MVRFLVRAGALFTITGAVVLTGYLLPGHRPPEESDSDSYQVGVVVPLTVYEDPSARYQRKPLPPIDDSKGQVIRTS